MTPTVSKTSSSRRDFFKQAGGLVVGFSLASTAVTPILEAAESFPTRPPGRLDSWLQMGKDGSVTVFTDKVEIGMGVNTSFRQIVAEELDVPIEKVLIVLGDTGSTPDQGGVGGSTSIPFGARPLRNASASARFLLVEAASKRLGVPADMLEVSDGVVGVRGNSSKRITYAELVADVNLDQPVTVSGSAFNVNIEGKGKPKDPSTYKIVGRPVPRADLAEKIFGKATYAPDVRLPGMLHGRVVRPSGIGSTLMSVDDSAAKKVPGYLQTVTNGNFLGVLASTEWAAIKAARELKVTWSAAGVSLPANLYEHMATVPPRGTKEGLRKGDPEKAISASVKRIEAQYQWPYQAHATMGPGCAVADVHLNGVTTVWCGSQKVHPLHRGLAELLGVPVERVRVIFTQDAGSYGRAGYEDAAADAVILSKAAGKPVRVQWMRSDMTAWGAKGPATLVNLVGGLDATGKIDSIQFMSKTFSGSDVSYLPDSAGNFLGAQLMGVKNTTARDEFVQLGEAAPVYDIPNIHSIGHVVPALHGLASPLNATHLRDPNGPAATFAMESFMDEMAALASTDPVDFRLKHVTNDRARNVIKAVAEKAAWESRPAGSVPQNGNLLRGRGVAYAERGGTHVATVVEVEVNRQTGAVRVKRAFCAHDCGLIVNPNGLQGVVAANLIQSLGRVLKEEVTFDATKITSVDWNTYPVMRMADIPEQVEIVLLNRKDIAPSGAGEPSTRPTAAAVANAIFDATSRRIRQVPLTPSRVKAVLV